MVSRPNRHPAALAHPLTILAAFVAAPVTPLIPPSRRAGFVAWWKPGSKPRVGDLERVADDVSSLAASGDGVTRILLVVIMANLGSSVGTFVGVGWIVALLGN